VGHDERVDIHTANPSSVICMTAQPMVTGDAVVLEVQIAQLPVRAISAVIDISVVFIGYLLGLVLWAVALSEFDDALSAATLIIFTVLAFVVYPVALEVATRGRSLGKMAMGLRVVSDDGGPERFRQALFRAMAAVIEIWALAGGPAVICSLISARGKRLGDVFAGTMVISQRAARVNPPPPMPPALAWWAASLELSGLGAGQAERARQFLSRARQLEPRVRDEMAHHIYAEVLAQLAPPPPRGAPAPLVLAAVLAERHRRELARLQPAIMPSPGHVAPSYAPPGHPTMAPPAARPPGSPSTPCGTPSNGFATPD
jgi:uncharacterized RDD family membrane protein YckC